MKINKHFIVLSFLIIYSQIVISQTIPTSGVITQSINLTIANSPFKLTGEMQIPENLSLTINEGVTFDGGGFAIKTKGNITVLGNKNNPVQIKNLTIYGLSGMPTIDINYASILNSNLTKPTGNSDNPKKLIIRNSYINTMNNFSGNDATIYIYQFPTIIENNILENSPAIVNTYVKSGESLTIRNNNFYSWPNNIYYKGVITLAVFDSSKYQVSGNCFNDTSKVAASYHSTFFTKEISLKNNFWGTTYLPTINKMIYDKNDDISYPEIQYQPILNYCPSETPKYITPKLKIREINLPIQLPLNQGKQIGTLDFLNKDSSLFSYISIKLKSKSDSQYVSLNGLNILIKDSSRFIKANKDFKLFFELTNGVATATDSVLIKLTCPPLIKPSIKTASNTSNFIFCEGDTLKLNIDNTTYNKGDTLKWFYGTKSDLTNVASKTFVDSEKVYVIKADSTGCQISSDTISITKSPKPISPSLIRDSDNNLVANTNSITWYKDGVKISDTTQKIKPTSNGNYTATTTKNGCTSLASANYYYLTSAVSNLSGNDYFKVSPNPTNGEIYLNYNIRSSKDVYINVIDMSGRSVISNKKVTSGSKLNLGSSMKGNYIILVKDKSGRLLTTEKLIKN